MPRHQIADGIRDQQARYERHHGTDNDRIQALAESVSDHPYGGYADDQRSREFGEESHRYDPMHEYKAGEAKTARYGRRYEIRPNAAKHNEKRPLAIADRRINSHVG